MAKIYKSKNGKEIVLRNPAEKSKRFALQLKSGKVVETRKDLTETDKAFRRGYLTSRSDNAGAFRSMCRKNAKAYAENSGSDYREIVKDGIVYAAISDGSFTQLRSIGKKIDKKKNYRKNKFDSNGNPKGDRYLVNVDKKGRPYLASSNGKRNYDADMIFDADRRNILENIGYHDIDDNIF